MEPSNGAVGTNDPLLERERRTGGERLFNRAICVALPVVGDARVRDRRRTWARIHPAETENLTELLGAIHAVGRNIPVIAAKPGDALRFRKLRLPPRRLLFGSLAICDVQRRHRSAGPRVPAESYSGRPVTAIQCSDPSGAVARYSASSLLRCSTACRIAAPTRRTVFVVHRVQRVLKRSRTHRLCPPRRRDEDPVIPDVPLPRADIAGRDGQPQTFLAGAQRLRLAVLDDGDGRRMSADVDQLPMPIGGTARRRK